MPRLIHGHDSSLSEGEMLMSQINSKTEPSVTSPSIAEAISDPGERVVRDTPLSPYGLPTPPKSWLFAGLGYGYGVGCTIGPTFGIGVGFGPRGVQFGAGATIVGAFCGVGFAGGAIIGEGSAYVPYGLNSSFFLAPRFVMLEQMAELYRARSRQKKQRLPVETSGERAEADPPDEDRPSSRAPRNRAIDSMWPPAMRRWWRNVLQNTGIDE
jgi:hypothetical protein